MVELPTLRQDNLQSREDPAVVSGSGRRRDQQQARELALHPCFKYRAALPRPGEPGNHAGGGLPMIDQTTLITYLAILTGFVFLPGPATILTLARATSAGSKVGMATGLGIAVGDLIHTGFAVLGLSAIVLTSAFLFNLVKYTGAAYLIYLGIRAILDRVDGKSIVPGAGAATGHVAGLVPVTAFRQAVIAEVLNPKSAMFFLSFLPQFVRPENGSVALQLSVFGVLFVVMGLTSTMIVAFCAGGVGRFLRQNPTVLRWQGKVVGGIYVALGIRLALQEK